MNSRNNHFLVKVLDYTQTIAIAVDTISYLGYFEVSETL